MNKTLTLMLSAPRNGMVLGSGFKPLGEDSPKPSSEAPSGSCECARPLQLLRAAVIAKYGGTPEEAAFKFLQDVAAITPNSVGGAEPTLAQKLEALKAEVGEATYEKLLQNADIERLASRAYRRTADFNAEKIVEGISKLLNGALDTVDIIEAQLALLSAEDEIEAIANA